MGTLHTCNPITRAVLVEDVNQAIENKRPLLPSTESNRYTNQFGLGFVTKQRKKDLILRSARYTRLFYCTVMRLFSATVDKGFEPLRLHNTDLDA